jgi:hypothetical protein
MRGGGREGELHIQLELQSYLRHSVAATCTASLASSCRLLACTAKLCHDSECPSANLSFPPGDRNATHTANTREMTPADGLHQQQGRSPIQQLLSPQQSARSDLIGTAWLPDGTEYAPGYLSSRRGHHPGHNTPVSVSPQAATPQEQQHWGHSSMQHLQQQQQQAQQVQEANSLQSHALQALDSLQTVESAGSSVAAGAQDRPQSRNSSPVRRRLAEAMVLEAKAAAAAVLRGPQGSGTSSMCNSPADTGRTAEQQQMPDRPYAPTRSTKGSGKPIQHDYLTSIQHISCNGHCCHNQHGLHCWRLTWNSGRRIATNGRPWIGIPTVAWWAALLVQTGCL